MSRYAIEYSRQRGPQGANGNDGAGTTAIPNNTLLGNTSGGAAIPVARTAVQMGLQPYSANLDRLDGTAAEQRNAIGLESFESVAANALGYPATIAYNSDGSVNTVTYTVPAGTIVKTFSYSGGNVSAIVLSGNTPSGISLTKTLTYTGDDITGVSYS